MEYFKLKELRKLARLSQQEVASFLGITSQAYGHYERGDRTPDPQTLKKLAEYFGVTVDYLLQSENNLRLKQLRKERKLTQTDVANVLGITYQAYAHYEKGRHQPDPQSLKKLADFFDVSVDYLLGRSEIDDEDKIKAIGGFALPPMRTIKVYGEFVCGKPVCEWETDEGTVSIDYKHPEEYFALKVRGDSMINAGIRPKSIVIVHKQSWAESGDIVVACLDGESTLKRYKEKDGIIVLMPENPAYSPILITKKAAFYIFGKVVEVRVSF